MGKTFWYLLKKDVKMMLSGKFFLLALLSLVLYSCYINFIYINVEQDSYHVYLYDPNNLSAVSSEYITKANSRQELEYACADRTSIGVDLSADTPEIYMLSSGAERADSYRAIWGEAIMTWGEAIITQGENGIVGSYNKEEKSRREITAEFLFFELSAVGFLGLASILFKEKQMGVIRVHGILPVSRTAFILSKLCVFLLSDLVFALLLVWINVGIRDSFAILPAILVQTGILSLIMALIGFLCAIWLPDFKQFSLFYLVLAVFVTTPVFLAGQTGVLWNWMNYHPMYHLFTAMKSACFGEAITSVSLYLVSIGTIAALFYAVCHAFAQEMTKEG